MKTRIISGLILFAVTASTFVFGGLYLGAFCILVSVVSYFELTRACGIKGDKLFNGFTIAGYLVMAAYYFILLFKRDWFNMNSLVILVVVIVMASLGVYVFTFPKYKATQAMTNLFCLLYAPFLFSFLYLIREDFENGAFLVFLVLGASSASDAAAYFVGVAMGKHKLAPVLSPKKTIEGAIGGIVGAAAISAIYGIICLNCGVGGSDLIWKFAIASGVGSIISQIGDLAASAIKRDYDIKDYGKVIPGHGGAMDRVDSIVVVAPIIYYALMLIMK